MKKIYFFLIFFIKNAFFILNFINKHKKRANQLRFAHI